MSETRLQEINKKSQFISEEYCKLAKIINPDIEEMYYVHHSDTNNETLVIFYKTGYKKMIDITADSLKAIVFDSIIKL